MRRGIAICMIRILVTNDDGHFSPGIHALAAALRPLGDVVIVAPQTEASAVGHALTLRRPLRVEHVSEGDDTTDWSAFFTTAVTVRVSPADVSTASDDNVSATDAAGFGYVTPSLS